MMDHDIIYQSEAERYDQLVSREDQEGNLLRIIQAIVPDLARIDAADIGAGTGRLTRLLAPQVKTILATDASQAMLDIAERHLSQLGLNNWKTKQGLHERLPIADDTIDLLTAGWTICYSSSTNIPNWQRNLQAIIDEISRVLKPAGTAIIFENFGTGTVSPNPPDFLMAYYGLLEQHYGFEHTYIRTDCQFDTLEEAVGLTDFFFGSELSQQVTRTQSCILPACTGVWWKKV